MVRESCGVFQKQMFLCCLFSFDRFILKTNQITSWTISHFQHLLGFCIFNVCAESFGKLNVSVAMLFQLTHSLVPVL